MNRQRKVLITTTYNELGIIIDTKAEEVAQPDLQPTCNQLATDCISRQQAIDALDKHIDTFDAIDTNYLCGLRTAMSILKEMPSAQTETHDKRTETHECDLINRQQAIDALCNDYCGGHQDCKYYPNCENLKSIKQLPSAQPERKKGKWIKLYAGNYKCSVCGDWCGNDNNEMVEDFKYCPNCGARMDGENE